VNSPIFTQPPKQHNNQAPALARMRDYLAGLENIARRGRLSSDPQEVKAAVWTFARPSVVLARLAEKDRRLA
jgi:hypothetical protein